MKIDTELPQRRSALTADALDHRPRFRHDHTAERRPARFDYAGLLSGNAGQAIAQLSSVVETNAREQGRDGIANIGRVEPPAQTDFDHRRVDTPSHKMQEADGGGNFEERRQ